MKAQVVISLKSGVLDPEAVAIARLLKNKGFSKIAGVRMAKIITLELDPSLNSEQAQALALDVAQKVLINPVIEQCKVEII